ncbi:Zinc finger family protein isoform 1 [Theobroma cacao]|uniref:Zinc finger family protein isoform 1 n=1 Tax=Theobroma cacao TaxID=3641 RepID=A0A061GVB3_THECC|nr:Zinc finger family protein isoform 1 [Theobroma cacao]EOY33771.1 Zinc finger family protein isoform 1 [Theobroma cacao]
MAKTIGSVFFNKFLSLFILLLHLGCFIFTAKDHHKPAKKRKASPLSLPPPSLKPNKALSSTWSCLKRIFSSSKANCKNTIQTHPTATTTPTLTSARNSQQSLVSMIIPPETHLSESPPTRHEKTSGSCPESDISSDNQFFPLRNDIFPCTACGEIFQKPHFLEQHQATKHAVSELIDGDSGKNIVRIIFKTGWTDKVKNPEIHRILKIHNSPKILARFEDYRELVKAKAARNGIGRRYERCIADGNELLRFYCSTFMCDLGLNGSSSICNQQYCSICGIIKSGFSPKMDGIPTLSTSWRAHVAIPEDVEEEFKFMNVKRAMLVCRVVAGRVGSEGEEIDKEDGGFDSVIGRGGGSGAHTNVDEEELLVFNPRAVLPCFVIVYTV